MTDITLKGLRGRLDPKGVSNGYEYSDRKILCTIEEIQLAKWVRGEGDAGRPPTRDQVRQEVVRILDVRRQTRWGGRCTQPLIMTL